MHQEPPQTKPTAIARILGDLQDRGALQGKHIADIADVSRATVSRWSHSKGAPDIRIQAVMATLGFVVNRLHDLYSPEEVRIWLYTYHPGLKGRAIDLIIDNRVAEVLAEIERLDAGAHI